MANKGFVVALDGPDGVGKTTQVKLLAEYFQSKGRKVHVTRSSGGTLIGEELRKVSLSQQPRPAETDLFISLAMGAALAEDIQKRKAAGEVVIIDRSPLAIVAYNGYGSQLVEIKLAFSACEALVKRWQIDLLLFLTAPGKTIGDRRKKRGAKDYFESKGPDYHKRVLDGYAAGLDFLQKHAELGAKTATIDAKGEIDDIHQKIIKKISSVTKTSAA